MSTYTPIASANTQSGVSSITFANLPQNYQSLRIIINGRGVSGSGYSQISYRYNNDTSTNYSWVAMLGAGSSTGFSNKGSNQTAFYCGFMTDPSTTIGLQITEINNYATPNAHKIAISRWGYANSAANLTQIAAGQYRSTNSITSITIFNAEGTAFSTGTTINIYGFESGGPKAFGGDTVTTDGTYYYHTFRSSGTFTPAQNLTCDYLVVAGGGGSSELGGGGGAGGLRSTVTATGGGGALESALSLTANTAYTVTVGAGGAGGQNPNGGSGNNSVFATITSTGGGGGGRYDQNGLSGGSGGGAGRGASTTGGAASPSGQGYAGGNGLASYGTGSGGGAGAAGQNAVSGGQNNGGNGGNGVAVSISGSSVTYAGGGGGGGGSNSNPGTGGTGGGGSGGDPDGVAGANGTANTGGGAGGGAAGGGSGGAGGSGIVIIRYAV